LTVAVVDETLAQRLWVVHRFGDALAQGVVGVVRYRAAVALHGDQAVSCVIAVTVGIAADVAIGGGVAVGIVGTRGVADGGEPMAAVLIAICASRKTCAGFVIDTGQAIQRVVVMGLGCVICH